MKDREKQHLYKALVGVLIGFMFTLIAIFTVVAFHFLLPWIGDIRNYMFYSNNVA